MKKYIMPFLAFLLLITPVKADALSVSARAAALINGDTGEVIYSENADIKMPMASTTKIMTGILLCEYGNFDREITVTSEMLKVEGSSMGLIAGDKITLKDLLYGLMLASGNDAANVIAVTVGGSLDAFVDLMNNKARELGLRNTHFATPSGLDADEHYTTAYELCVLTQYALKNQDFANAVSTEKAVLEYGNPPYKRTLANHNKMLKMYSGAIGVKTGFTKKSGRCLVTAAKRDGKYVIAVTLNAPNDWSDHTELLDFGFSSIKQTNYTPFVNCYNIPIINGDTEILTVNIRPLVINTLETENISCKVNLPNFLYAPLNTGETVGNVVYYQGDTIIGKVTLLSEKNISEKTNSKNFFHIVSNNIKYIFSSIRE